MKLIINADDFGLTPSVNKAIIDVYQAGNLTSTTLMVNMPGTNDAIIQSNNNPGLAIGLHFCITEGKPLSENPASLLQENGIFISRGELLKALLKGRINPKDILAEFKAQYERMLALGLTPTHTDSHQHTMMFPGVYNALHDYLNEIKLPLRITMPPKVKSSMLVQRPSKFLKQKMNQRFAKKIKHRSQTPINNYIVSVHDLEDQTSYTRQSYINLLSQSKLSGFVELMVHPYLEGQTLKELYPETMVEKQVFIQKCVNEYNVLSKQPLFSSYKLCTFEHLT